MNGLAGWVAVNVARMGGVMSVAEVVAVVLAVILDAVLDPDKSVEQNVDTNVRTTAGESLDAATQGLASSHELAGSPDLAERNVALAGGLGGAGLADVEGADLADPMIVPGTQESAGLGGGASGCLTLATCS